MRKFLLIALIIYVTAQNIVTAIRLSKLEVAVERITTNE